MLVSLPCIHEGPDLNWDIDGLHYQTGLLSFHPCNHPDTPLGEENCRSTGCGPTCKGYTADETQRDGRGGTPLHAG